MMNPWWVTLSVNAGISLYTEGLKIWVDALHDRKVPGFSTLTPELRDMLFDAAAFQNPDVIAFTHCHPDHFSETLCQEAVCRFPKARLILPERRFPNQLLLRGGEVIVPAGERRLTFRKLTHEGPEYAEVLHYGLMIEDGGENILVLGDCALQGGELETWIAGRPLDTVFAPFPWLTLPGPRAFLSRVLRPRHLFLYHLPLEKDDDWHYRRAAVMASQKPGELRDMRFLMEPFQTERF